MKILKRLFKYYLKYLPRVILGIVAIIFMTQFDILNTFIVKKLIDIFSEVSTQLSNKQPIEFIFSYQPLNIFLKFKGQKEIFNLVIFIAIVVFISIVMKGFFSYIKKYTLSSAILKSLRDIRQDIYKKIIIYRMKFYDSNKTGDLMAKITNDVSMVQETFNSFINIASDFIQSVCFLTLMFYLNWQLSFLIIMMFPVTGFILKKFAIPIRKAQLKIAENISHITSFLQETLSGIKVIKIFVKEKYETEKFKALTQATYARNMKSVRLIAIQRPINELLGIIGVLIVILFSSYQMLNGKIAISDFGRYIIIVTMIYKPLKGIGKINTAIQKAIASGHRIFELMDVNEREDVLHYPSKKRIQFSNINGKVEFKKVSFEYKEKQIVLENISFKAEPGEIIAIVGHSGSGKTTIVNLIPKFYNYQKGKILIDNKDLKYVDCNSLRQFIAVVPQDTFLFSGTIKENIAYAKENAAMDEIKEAAMHANAHKFIMKLKNKYNTEVGEKGVQLSGGEKQRISIARAVLKNPKILILDEATSALDTQSEILVQQALNYLMKNRTTFIIAHRLSTIKNANKILVIENGQIIQIGSHKELIKKKKELYFKLCNAQQLFK